MEHKKHQIILIKLSGEALGGKGEQYHNAVIEDIARQISVLLKQDVQVALVVGGGNLFRGAELVKSYLSIRRATADYVGMLATLQNALVLRDYFESQNIPSRVLSSISVPQLCEPYIPERGKRHLAKGRVVIFAAGLGVPFFTTDTTAAERALEIEADTLVLSKNGVDGLYDGDPKMNPKAKKITTTTCSEVLKKNLRVADGAAISLAKDNGLPIRVVSISDIENIFNKEIGSLIEPK